MSRPLWTRDEVVEATGGRAPALAWAASGVAIDSRTVAPGDLFVALAGPHFDGHDFVAEAFARGAVAALVHRRPAAIASDAALVEVGDTFEGIYGLAAHARARMAGKILAVTGSVGKTSVKEALRLVLGEQDRTVASAGNLNNHWGVPLSLARLPAATAFGIIEMGMNHAGEITPLSRLARPHVAVITAVEAVHLEHFPSVAAIADAKAEIFAGIAPDGAAVLPRDNPHYPRLADAARAAGVTRFLGFGSGPNAEVRLADARPDAAGTAVRAHVLGRDLAYRVGLPGTHWVANSLCVLATVAAVGADVAATAARLADLQPATGRGIRHVVALAGGSFTLIDDSYNASPVSMAASFEVLGRSRPGAGGRRIAVLGDMLELGDDAPALHAGLALPLLAHRIDLVFTAGTQMAALAEALPAARHGGHAADSAAIAPLVAAALRPGDVVAVKGSAGSRMGRVVEVLKALAGDAPGNDGTAATAAGG